MPVIRIAQAQINTTVGDFSRNSAKIIDVIRHARDQGVELITFPELSVCGYPPEDLLLKRGFLYENLAALEQIREQTDGITAVVGHADYQDGKVYNAASVFQGRKRAAIYHKIELPNYGVFDEKRYFTRGSRSVVFEMNRIRFFLTICEDIWIEGGFQETTVKNADVDVIINISASPFHAGKLDLRLRTAARFARMGEAFFCFNNLIGGQDELVFDGGSFVMDPQGKVVARAKRFEEDVLVADIQIEASRTPQMKGPAEEAEALSVPLGSYEDHPRGELFPPVTGADGRLDEIYQALVLGTRDYVIKNGFKKAVIGLSGGIDSALTAVIAVDALGPENVVGVTMPSQYTSGETLGDAGRLARNLEIQLITVPIGEIYQAYLHATHEILDNTRHGIAHENIQARIRGNILMALSNENGWLVLTTGNKSEIAVGYCTLYGDMAGGFAVIKDVPKTVVFELSERVNHFRGREIIPESIIVRPPSAELRPDQKDEDSLPPYAMLDRILHAYVEEDKAPHEIMAEGFDREVVKDVIRMVNLNEYKRRQGPPGVKITPKAFGRDRRLPITNAYLKRID
ncbi:MAG: NAD+ synthase [Candidatus Desulfacyla sp.]